MKPNTKVVFTLMLALCAGTILNAAPAPAQDARDRQMRERYETVLLRNPFQDRAFNQVYDSYAGVEGVDAWVESLKPKAESADAASALLLLGQIYDRQFKTVDAITMLEKAAGLGEERPQFTTLLGTLYYKVGQDEKAAALLGKALDTLTDLDQRSAVCRMLGNLYLRQGKRDEAIRIWKRISEQNSGEIFSVLELAEIYEDNRMWDEAIQVYRQVIERSEDDPYRKCRALRSIGQCLVNAEKHQDAIATYEQALGLVAPGNWLFEDLKLRLVGVYEDIGDLSGLAKYLQAKLDQNPAELEFRDLLAETLTRMARFDDAEKEYQAILERNPRSSSIYEKLIALYTRTNKREQAAAAFEKLIEFYPRDSDYLRRLGEFHLLGQQPEKARETWRRIVQNPSTPEQLATLAGWLESYEFADEAIAAYQQALEKAKNKEWLLRVAALKYQKGDEAESLKLWLSVIDPATSKPEDYADVASILETHQKIDEALALRRTAVEKDPANLEARLALGKILMRQQKAEEAAEQFAVLAGQDENEFLKNQGENGQIDAWRELGVLEAKQKALESELNANPSDAKKLGQLARLLERSGQREKAIALYEARREKEPANVEYVRALAALYKGSKQTEQAIAAFKTLVETDKNRARVYQKELLDIYLAVDLKTEAIAAGEALASLAPSDPEVRLSLAQVYQIYRQPEKALNEYRFALRLEPNEPDYHRQYGEALEQEKRYGEAQEAFRKMLDAAKEDSTRLSAVANLARIHLQQDRLPELLSEFQRRIRNTPKKLAAYEELAAVYKESGQIFRSVEVIESGLQTVDDKTSALKSLIRLAYEAQDFSRVKTSFEQLVAMSGKPTASEYERLGQIHAQLGDVEKAKATWNQILAGAAKDPKLHDRVAKLLQDHGFRDEAIVLKNKAVDLDSGDYKRRFEYAQMLAQNQQPIQAMDQVRLLLEIGDREEQKEKEAEKKVQRLNRGQRSNISTYQFMQGGGRMMPRYYGGSTWQGSFKDFRPSVLQFMASLAQQSIGEEAFIEQFQERAKKPGASPDLRRDLLTVLQMFNRIEEALALAESLIADSPQDTELLQNTALLYSNQQQLDKAIPLLERLAQLQPKQRLAAATGLVPLYFKNKEPEKALALVEALATENPNDSSTIYTMSNMLQSNGKFEEAKRLLLKLKESDPQMVDQVRNWLANLAKQSGKQDEALALYREAILAEPQRAAYYARGKRVEIYAPDINPANMGRMYSNPMQGLPQPAFGAFDYMKLNALGELKIAAKAGGESSTNIFDEMKAIALGWSPASTPSQRDRAWDMARLLVGHYVVEKDFDAASGLLGSLRKAGCDEAAWFNISIYISQLKEDTAAMAKYYDELQQRYPAKGRDIAIARTHTHLLAKNFEEASKAIRLLNEQRVPPAQILTLIGHLQRAGENRLAQALLEEHLSGVSRNPQALSLLAQIYAGENDFDRAIALANEAWERKAQGTPGGMNYYSGMVYYSSMPRYGQVDNLLNELHRYYVGAGKSDELLNRFKATLEKQPGSIQAYENLASLYRLNQERDKALELYQELAEKRPHLHQVKRNIASLYQEMGQFDKATQLYEDLIKANPSLYQSFQWELRWAYQRQGKGKELQKMEDTIASRARDPNQLLNLAFRMREDGEVDKAIDLMRKAVKMAPGQMHIQSQLAGMLVDKGQLDEALKAYEEWFSSPQMRAQNFLDHATLRQFAGLYKANGKLDDLKLRCETELKKNPADRISRALQAHIAFLEKRYTDALAGFKATLQAGNDPNVISQLIELASFSGNFKEVLEVAEKTDTGASPWNAQQLSSLYVAAGDKKKAAAHQLKWAEQMSQQGNGSYALQETMNQLSQLDLWDELEQYVAKRRTDAMEQWEAEEFDRTIAMRYVTEGRFESIVTPLLTKESLKGRDLSLVQKISEQYSGQPEKRLAFIEKLVAADPKNRDLAFTLAQLYSKPDQLQRRHDLLIPLIESDANKPEYRRALAETLIDMGRANEALTALGTWAAERPGEQRWLLLSDAQVRAGRVADARASLVKAIDSADKVRKNDLQIRLASFDSRHGDTSAERDLLRTNFETKKDAQSFQTYWRFLQQNGWLQAAHQLFVTNKESGYFEQYQQNDFLDLCLNHSDYASAADLNWRFTRFGNRWERDWQFDRIAKVYRDRGKMAWFVQDFASRVEQDAGVNDSLRERVARSWEQAGAPEKALALYDAQLAKNPLNRSTIQLKAGLLLKLGRSEEAIALLRDTKGVTTLDQESSAKMLLIETLFTSSQKEEANREMRELMSWDRRPQTLMRLAGFLMDQQEYARALELFEKALAGVRDYNYDELLMGQAKCRAKLGDADDLVKLTDTLLRSSQNAQWRVQGLQSWLSSEGFHELAVRVIQRRLEKQPAQLDLHTGLATALAQAGRAAEAFAACESAARVLPPESVPAIQSSLASVILAQNLLDEALKRHESQPSPVLTGALVDVLARTAEEPEKAAALIGAAASLQPDHPEQQLRLADALMRHKQVEPAAAWYRKALASTNEFTRLSAAIGLAHAAGDPAAAPVLAKFLQERPHWFIGGQSQSYQPFLAPGPYIPYPGGPFTPYHSTMHPSIGSDGLIRAVAKLGDASLIEQAKNVINSGTTQPVLHEYHAAMIDFHRGATNEARPRLAALADAPHLKIGHLNSLASLLDQLGMKPERVKVLRRIASGGFPLQDQTRAQCELVKIHSDAGDFKSAVSALAAAHSAWGMLYCEEARLHLADAVNTGNFEVFKSAVAETLRANPSADAASNLAGLCQQIAQRLDRSEPAGKMADDAKLALLERYEAAAWDGLIEQWEIAGPLRGAADQNPGQMVYNPTQPQPVSRQPEPTLASDLRWTATDPKRELGVIRVGSALKLKGAESNGQFAYARTTLTSPEDRSVTFCFGCDDWASVWVNGQFVFRTAEPRSCALDQDRFPVMLRKGENKILIKVGNNTDAWNLCLRITEPGDVLALAAELTPPSAPGARAEAR